MGIPWPGPTYIYPESLVDDDKLAIKTNSNSNHNSGNQDSDKGENEVHFGIDL